MSELRYQDYLKHLNNITKGYSDMALDRHPLSKPIYIAYCNQKFDHYQDEIGETYDEVVYKRALIRKNVDIKYVQQLRDGDQKLRGVQLKDNVENLYWLCFITTTDLPKQPSINDIVLIDNVQYKISAVKPVNRQIESTIWLLIYPNRVDLDIKLPPQSNYTRQE